MADQVEELMRLPKCGGLVCVLKVPKKQEALNLQKKYDSEIPMKKSVTGPRTMYTNKKAAQSNVIDW